MLTASALQGLFVELATPVLALALAAARLFGLVSVLPLFTRLGLSGLLRGSVALAFALLMAPKLMAQPALLPASSGMASAMLVKEAAVGLALGLVFALPFWVIESAGELIDQQRGSSSAILPDPSATEESGITATLLVLAGSVVFLGMGGLRWLLQAVLDSYAVWPATDVLPRFAPDAGGAFLGVLDQLLLGGFVFASPLVTAMLLAELALALINRFASQINVFDMSLSLKGIIYAVGMPLYVYFMLGYMRTSFLPLTQVGRELRRFAG